MKLSLIEWIDAKFTSWVKLVGVLRVRGDKGVLWPLVVRILELYPSSWSDVVVSLLCWRVSLTFTVLLSVQLLWRLLIELLLRILLLMVGVIPTLRMVVLLGRHLLRHWLLWVHVRIRRIRYLLWVRGILGWHLVGRMRVTPVMRISLHRRSLHHMWRLHLLHLVLHLRLYMRLNMRLHLPVHLLSRFRIWVILTKILLLFVNRIHHRMSMDLLHRHHNMRFQSATWELSVSDLIDSLSGLLFSWEFHNKDLSLQKIELEFLNSDRLKQDLNFMKNLLCNSRDLNLVTTNQRLALVAWASRLWIIIVIWRLEDSLFFLLLRSIPDPSVRSHLRQGMLLALQSLFDASRTG